MTPGTYVLGNPWDNDFMAFKVKGSPVPIPGAIWLLGSELAGIIGLKNLKRNKRD
jgi:hypothetical protein